MAPIIALQARMTRIPCRSKGTRDSAAAPAPQVLVIRIRGEMNILEARVTNVIYQGDTFLLQAVLADGSKISARNIANSGAMAAVPRAGEMVRLGLSIQDTVLHTLRSYGFQNTADAYECYRWGRHWLREGAISQEHFAGNGFPKLTVTG